ncbi:hypothetical protein F4604DRAFT_1683989 [Suillus subluteus]|nr:hypothetical protein F4604DRAFT_1683989 [Suillus subluteus]
MSSATFTMNSNDLPSATCITANFLTLGAVALLQHLIIKVVQRSKLRLCESRILPWSSARFSDCDPGPGTNSFTALVGKTPEFQCKKHYQNQNPTTLETTFTPYLIYTSNIEHNLRFPCPPVHQYSGVHKLFTKPNPRSAFAARGFARSDERCYIVMGTLELRRHTEVKLSAIEDGGSYLVVDIVGTGVGHCVQGQYLGSRRFCGRTDDQLKVILHFSSNLAEELNSKHGSPKQGSDERIFHNPSTVYSLSHIQGAIHHHYRASSPYRKSLPFRTLFNVLEPIIDSARLCTSTKHGFGRA